jgi:response regulator RpfG family c-di-GMP phosphodiesterase
MTNQNRPLVLCVDDEVRVVESLALALRRDFEVQTALSGQEGLAKLKAQRGFAVVVSDMRMPGMDGAVFLKHVMRHYPEISRILLTGDPGRDAAVLAVNEGQIFRYLTKPCPPQLLHSAIDAGVVQYRLVHAERAILRETLIGCVQALIDVLAITNPVAFGRASRVKRLCMQLADELSCTGFWQLEGAAMLSQIGYLSLPVELVEKLYYGERLTPEERTLAEGVPQVAHKLLAHIPRLEPVLQILSAVSTKDEAMSSMGDGTVAMGARMLSLVLDYDGLVTQGVATDVAVQTLRAKAARYSLPLVETFATLIGASSAAREMREMPLRMVKPGMTIMDDLRTHLGTLLVPRGFDITETFLQRLHNFGAGILAEKVRVLVPIESARAGAR